MGIMNNYLPNKVLLVSTARLRGSEQQQNKMFTYISFLGYANQWKIYNRMDMRSCCKLSQSLQ